MEHISALVTAGATREFVDDIRFISNISTGRLGLAIAHALHAADCNTELLAGYMLRKLTQAQCCEHCGANQDTAGLRISSFDSFEDLQNEMKKFTHDARKLIDSGVTDRDLETCEWDLRHKPGFATPNIIFMASAPCDYRPTKQDGKISSDDELLRLDLVRNEKLISQFRHWYGTHAFLVGFKLLSGVSRERLIDVAQAQLKKCRLNLVVANDLQYVKDGQHPIIVVTPEGGAIDFTGTKEEVAKQLVDFVRARSAVQWARSERVEDCTENDHFEGKGFENASRLLAFSQRTGLLVDENGNISARSGHSFHITPRGVHKAGLHWDALFLVEPDLESTTPVMRFHSHGSPYDGNKPSIDSHVHALLYRDHPDIEAIVHTHDCMIIPDTQTTFPYPCGTREEADEVSLAMTKCQLARLQEHDFDPPLEGYGIHLIEHGFILLIPDLDDFFDQWERVREGYFQHLRDVGQSEIIESLSANNGVYSLTPLILGSDPVGVQLTAIAPGFVSVWLHPDHRSDGIGERFVRLLDKKGLRVAALDDCEVRAYYEARGWLVENEENALTILSPPSKRDDLVKAASVVMYCLGTHSVLIGERLVGAWEGFYSFPGGKVEEDEIPWLTAFRELKEETGVDHLANDVSSSGDPIVITIADNSGRAYSVHNFLGFTNREIPPTDTAEMKARWVKLEDALELKIAHGTKRILSGLKERLRETY